MPKVLFIGDIVGRPGRNFVAERVAALKAELDALIVVANGENAAGGAGITTKIANELFEAGVDAITLGDHVWDQKQFDQEIDAFDDLCRPANLPPNAPGRSYLVVVKGSFRLGVFTLLGQNFMGMKSDCPFRGAASMLDITAIAVDATLVEAHMEATSEKVALGWYLDGRASAVVGAHTHVPTADERVLPRGTAYITDVGMTGAYRSVLGREVSAVVAGFLDGVKRRYEIADQDVRLCGALIDIDEETGMAESIERVRVDRPEHFEA